MTERRRIGKISIWAILWRVVVLGGILLFIFALNEAGSGGHMLSSFFEWMGMVAKIILFVLLVILFIVFANLGKVLETDGVFLYVVEFYYFKSIVSAKIKIEDISKIVFVGGKSVTVVIQSGDKECCLKVKKDDAVYKYLRALASSREISQKDDELARKIVQRQKNYLKGKIFLGLVIAVLLWLNWEMLLLCIMELAELLLS